MDSLENRHFFCQRNDFQRKDDKKKHGYFVVFTSKLSTDTCQRTAELSIGVRNMVAS